MVGGGWVKSYLRTRMARLVPSMRRLTHLSLVSSLFSLLSYPPILCFMPKKQNYFRPGNHCGIFSGIRGSFARSRLFSAGIGGRNKKTRLAIILSPMVRTQTWTWWEKAVLTIFGTSMRIDICQIHGQDSRSLHYCRGLQSRLHPSGVLLVWESSKMIYVVREAAYKNSSNFQTWLFVARHVKSIPEKGKSNNGPSKNQSPTMLGNWEASIYRSRWCRVQRNPSGTQGRRWIISMEAAMPCKLRTKNASQQVAGHRRRKQRNQQNVEAHESTRKRVESTLPKDQEDPIAEREDSIRWVTTIWCTSLFLCLKRWKFRMRKQHWTRNGKSSKRFQHGRWTKVKSNRRSFWKHKKSKEQSMLLRWWTSVISKMRELQPKYQKYKGRVVLQGDIAKDDSGSHAVFTEQCSCASQRRPQKVMDVIARVPDCAGQGADAVSAYTPK